MSNWLVRGCRPARVASPLPSRRPAPAQVNMAFSFVVMDIVFVYVRYNLYLALPQHLFKSRRTL